MANTGVYLGFMPVTEDQKICCDCGALRLRRNSWSKKNFKASKRCRACNALASQKASRKYDGDPALRQVHYMLTTRYKMSAEDYDGMLTRQGGVCAACGQAQERQRLSVDHDHSCCSGIRSCGKCVRGLLCAKCNSALGLVGDSVEKLMKLAAYIERTAK